MTTATMASTELAEKGADIELNGRSPADRRDIASRGYAPLPAMSMALPSHAGEDDIPTPMGNP